MRRVRGGSGRFGGPDDWGWWLLIGWLVVAVFGSQFFPSEGGGLGLGSGRHRHHVGARFGWFGCEGFGLGEVHGHDPGRWFGCGGFGCGEVHGHDSGWWFGR